MEDTDNKNPEKKPPKKPVKKARKTSPSSKPVPKDKSKEDLNPPLKPKHPSINFAALSAMFSCEDSSRARYRKNVKLMCSQVEEYMSSYIIIGYDLDGEPVNVTYSPDTRGYDALSTGLQKYVYDSLHQPPSNPL